MVQGLFDETEDSSDSGKKVSSARRSIFSDDALIELTKSTYKRDYVKKLTSEAMAAAEAEAAAMMKAAAADTETETATEVPSDEIKGEESKVQHEDISKVEEIPSPDETAVEKEILLPHESTVEEAVIPHDKIDEIENEEATPSLSGENEGKEAITLPSFSDEQEVAEIAETVVPSDETEFENATHSSPDMTEINEGMPATLMSPSVEPEIDEKMFILPDKAGVENAVSSLSDETKIEEAVSLTDETDETDETDKTKQINVEGEPLANEINVQEKTFAQPEINVSFSDSHDSFSAAQPIIETDKKDAPSFQMQYTPELPEDTARKTGLALSAGIALFVAVVFMMIIGWFADLLLGTSPWGLVCGIVIGSIIGFYQFFKTTSQIMK